MEGTTLKLIVEITTTMAIMFTTVVTTKGIHLPEAMGITYLIWNHLFSLEDLLKINSRMPFCVLDDGHVTIAMLQPL